MLVLWLSAFRIERCGYGADELVGLIDEERSAMRLVALTPVARAEGLRLGMTATEARARVPAIELVERDAAAEHEDLIALLRAFTALSDCVAWPWEEELVIEVSRTTRALGGEPAVVARAEEMSAELGHTCVAVLCDDPLAGRALCRAGCPGIVPTGGIAEALAPLPLDHLRTGPVLREALEAVGIETVGAFAKLDPASVAGRYGAEGAQLHRIARGAPSGGGLDWGAADEGRARVSVAMAGATSTLQLHFALPGLLSLLCARLRSLGQAAARLRVTLRLESGPPGAREVALAVRSGRPTTSAHTLERLVRTRLEGIRIAAPVEELAIEAVEVAPDTGWQPGLTDRAEATEPLPDLLARLTDHLGALALFAPERADSLCPETSWRPTRFPPTRLAAPAPTAAVRARLATDPVEIQQAWEQDLPLPRPLLLFHAPELLQVRASDGVPEALRLERGWVHVGRCVGPERLRGAWWSPEQSFDRAYWTVEVDGQVAWIYSEGARWFLHGWFD